MLARLALVALPLAALPAAVHAADPISGRWITQDKDAVVTIGTCGTSTCGRITRFLVPPPDGPDQRDIYNPDARKKSRRLMGLPVLFDFKTDSDQWRGRIYDPKTGKDYRSVVRRTGPNTLEVKGCIGPFCQTQVWMRAP